MKNMKKLVALFAATTMAMSLSVSAFAASYADGTLTLEAADFLDTGAQKTMMAYVVAGTVAEDNIPAYDATAGHTMIALNQDADLTGNVLVDADAVTEGSTIVIKTSGSNGSVNTILLAQEVTPVTYNVTYANVTDASYPTTVNAGSTLADLLALLTTAPTLDGYDFAYWSATENGERFTAEELATPIAADVTLYAVFTAADVTYTVTFLKADGSVYEEKTEVAKDTVISTIVPTTDPTKANSGSKKYAFIGWYTDSALSEKVADATVTENITLYPKFSQVGVYGDATGDGMVNMLDLMQIKQKVSNTAYAGNAGKDIPDCQTSSAKDGKYGDATGDGMVNMLDLMQVKQKVSNTAYAGNAGKDMVMIKD